MDQLIKKTTNQTSCKLYILASISVGAGGFNNYFTIKNINNLLNSKEITPTGVIIPSKRGLAIVFKKTKWKNIIAIG